MLVLSDNLDITVLFIRIDLFYKLAVRSVIRVKG